MELEEMKSAWENLNNRVEQQEILSKNLLEKIVEERNKAKMNKIRYSEYVGAIISYVGASYIIINFAKIDGLLLQACALLSVSLLFLMPVISFKTLREFKKIKISTLSYAEVLEMYALKRISFIKLQRINIFLGFFLMIMFLPVILAMNGKDINSISNLWTLIVPVSVLFFAAFSFFVLRWYSRILNEMKDLLQDLS